MPGPDLKRCTQDWPARLRTISLGNASVASHRAKAMIDPAHRLSIVRQAQLLSCRARRLLSSAADLRRRPGADATDRRVAPRASVAGSACFVSAAREGLEVGRKRVTTLMRRWVSRRSRKPRTSGRNRSIWFFPTPAWADHRPAESGLAMATTTSRCGAASSISLRWSMCHATRAGLASVDKLPPTLASRRCRKRSRATAYPRYGTRSE